MRKLLHKRVVLTTVVCFLAAASARPHDAIAQLPSSVACGPRAVAIATMLVEGDLEPEKLISSFDSVQGDHSLSEISKAVNKLGLHPSFARYDMADPALPECPVIVPIAREGSRDFHLVVLFGREKNVVQFIDYPHSRQFMEVSELSRLWSGEGIEVRAARKGGIDLPTVVNSCMLSLGAVIICLSVATFISRKLT